MRELTIDGQKISDSEPCYVIAEIGHNHQGKLDVAKEMFKVAKECGANAVKLQKRHNKELFTKEYYEKAYDNENSYGKTYGEHRETLEFNWDQYKELYAYAKEIGVTFFSTAFDFKSADFLEELGAPAYKMASADLKNTPLLKYVAKFQKPMIISTGGGTMEDVERAYNAIMPINPRLAILQCTAGYPAKFEELNLNVLTTFRKRFPDVVVGLSSHDNGISMPLVAYMLGGRVVEKHFTLNHTWKGTDHAFSLEPEGFRKMVRDLGRARVSLGDGTKKVHDSEVQPIIKMGKSLVAARQLPVGCRLTQQDVVIKSPGGGLAPYELENVLGKVVKVPLLEDEKIVFEKLEGNA